MKGVIVMSKLANSLYLAVILVLAFAGQAFAQDIDWATTLTPIKDTVMQAIVAAVAVGGALFAVILGIRKLVSVVRGMSGR